jgi:Copine/C2 domain
VFNNLNPAWSRVIFIEGYKFGVPLYFEVGVFDFDATQTGKTEQELSRMDAFSQAVITTCAASRALMRDGKFPHKVMGTALFEVGQILGARGNVGSKSLQSGGAIYVHMERCSSESDVGKIMLQLRGVKLHNTQSLGRTSSPFYELYRKVDRPTGATWISVYRSGAMRGDLNPLWSGINLDLEATSNGDLDRAMKVIVWDHRKTGKHKQMGEFETTMNGFIQASVDQNAQDIGFTLMRNDKEVGTIQVLEASLSDVPQRRQMENGSPIQSKNVKQGGKNGSSRQVTSNNSPGQEKARQPVSPNGQQPRNMIAQQKEIERPPARPEFVDYLSGGCQISLAVAIDFTASNGDPRQPGTPHYFHPPESKEWNDYEKAIFAVGSILAKYDSDQRFPVWGFGAKYNNVVRHCFQCGSEVEVEGVQGIMDAYRGVFRTPLTMSYPTKLTEIIQTAAAYARHEAVSSSRQIKTFSYLI